MIHPHKAGLALGGTIAGWHLLWSIVVALGWGQFLADWIFRLQFIAPPFSVGPFSLPLAAGLIVVTFVVGYVIGWVFATLWNAVHKS